MTISYINTPYSILTPSSSSHTGGVSINAMVMGPDEAIVCATSAQQILAFSMSQVKNIKEGMASLVGGLEYLVTSFHGPNRDGEAAITGIDVALW